MPQVQLIKGDKLSSNTDYRDALPENMYAVISDILGGIGYLLSYPGLTKFATGIGLDRGGFYNDRQGQHFRVSGGQLIVVNVTGTISIIGVIAGTKQVSLPYSFNSQAIITGNKMYLYDGSILKEVTDPDLGAPIDGVWVDGYYFLTDGEFIYHTELLDESSIDPLKFATAEFMPDKSVGVGKTQDNKIVVFGRYSMEYFVDANLPNFKFKRLETRAQKIGIVATHAKCEVANNWYITGGRRADSVSIYAVSLGSSTKIATREIDKILSQYSEPELADMRMESRSQDGITFILIHLPFETLCFNTNIAQNMGISLAWTILKTGLQSDNYRAINGIFDPRIGSWIYGDKRDNSIGILDNSKFTQYDEIQECILYSPFIKIDSKSINSIELEVIPGHTTFADAKVSVSLTYDGLTYGTEWFELYGLPSGYNKRFIIRRIGYVRNWVGFKFRAATRSRISFGVLDVRYG